MNDRDHDAGSLLKAWLIALATALYPLLVWGQWPFAAPTTPDAQRSALRSLQSNVKWLQNATRTAGNFGAQGEGNVAQAFQNLRQSYNSLKATLTPQQLGYGANDLAELDAGLDILEEAFANYQQALANGQQVSSAMRNMCGVLRQGSGVWWQQCNKTCSRLRVGWG